MRKCQIDKLNWLNPAMSDIRFLIDRLGLTDVRFDVYPLLEEDIKDRQNKGDIAFKNDILAYYRRGTSKSVKGAIIVVAIERHFDQQDFTETVAHEVGHGIWEYLTNETQIKWNDLFLDKNESFAEEQFADNMIYFFNGKTMKHEKAWFEIIKTIKRV